MVLRVHRLKNMLKNARTFSLGAARPPHKSYSTLGTVPVIWRLLLCMRSKTWHSSGRERRGRCPSRDAWLPGPSERAGLDEQLGLLFLDQVGRVPGL